jgi:hypothetical protein
MRKRTIVFLTLLAVGAFLASSPEALQWARELFAGSTSMATSRPADSGHPKGRAHGHGEAVRIESQAKSAELDNSRPSAGESQAPEDNPDAMNAVAAIPESDLQRALENSLRDDGTNATEFRDLLLRRWAEMNPKAVIAWAGSVGDPALAASSVSQAATVWADQDLSGALEWAKAMPEGPSREAAIVAIGYEGARTNSLEAFDLAASLPASAERDALLLQFVRQWSATESADALDWVDGIPDVNLREELLAAAAVTAATRDPQAAASIIATNLNRGRAQDQAAVAIVQRWAQTDPQAAASWVSQFPEGSVKAAASQALAASQDGAERGQVN